MSPPLDYLTKYLKYERTDEYKELYRSNDEPDVVELTFDEYLSKHNLNESLAWKGYNLFISCLLCNTNWNESRIWKGDKLPWSNLTCLAVVFYVIKLDNKELYRAITDLTWIAIYYHFEQMYALGNQLKVREKFSSLFVNTFIPMTREIFNVPELNELLVKDNSLKRNEILASFLDFLLQILNSEAEHRYGILQKELTFLLTILGDMPFRYTELEQVSNVLGEIETLANEAGNFIYSCVFTLHPVACHIFNEGLCAILEMAEILNIKIKQHCIKFSVEHSRVISPTNEVIDSVLIVNSLMEDLENMLNYQTHLIVDELNVQIMTLQDELKISRSLLKDIRSPQDTIHMDELNESILQVRDVAYEADYLVNSYVVGNLHLWYFNLRLPIVIRKFKLIRMRLEEAEIIGMPRLGKTTIGREVYTQTMGTSTIKTIDIVVGFEAEIAKISYALRGGGKNRQTISVIGMPGLGKTTIANKLFNDHTIVGHFDERGHCVVSQAYQKRKVLIEIMMSFSKSKTEKNSLSQMDDESLSLQIHQCLMGRRYLIYLDDVWSMDVWYDLQRYFPDHEGNGGSRIMLTSRISGISPTDSIVYSLPLLTEEQSWRLLEMKVFPKEACPPQLQSIGKRIATRCGGLPLAVVVTAGVLTNTENKESSWEKVETNLDSYMFSDGTNDYSKVLELSFTHLPNHLKMCFLYIGAYPEDAKISIRKLICLWISEGFIQREQGKSRELVAVEYLKDLINRNLIMIAQRKSDGRRIKACSIHDQLREMCIRKSQEGHFSKSVDYWNISIYEKHRLVFSNYRFATWESFGLYYRSFSGCLEHLSAKLPQMKLLRVMDILSGPNSSNYELEKVDFLFQLRYLAVNQMPKAIQYGNLVNLEFLVIRSKEIIPIPLVILKLVKLRHLDTGDAYFEKDCYSCETTNLRYFSKIRIYHEKDNEILRFSPHLVKLKCYYFNPTLFPDLHSHHDLQILNLDYQCYFSGELREVNFPSTITNLKLSNLGLPWEELSMIGKLPNLQVLKLGNHAFVGEEWKTRDGEFQELRFLRLYFNDLIKEWITCSEHFPQLECLEVYGCINLKEIPTEIGDISTLQMIKVHSSGDGAYRSAVEIVEEQRDLYGNELLQLQTSNNLKREEIVQIFQTRKLEMEEYKLKKGY